MQSVHEIHVDLVRLLLATERLVSTEGISAEQGKWADWRRFCLVSSALVRCAPISVRLFYFLYDCLPSYAIVQGVVLLIGCSLSYCFQSDSMIWIVYALFRQLCGVDSVVVCTSACPSKIFISRESGQVA